MLAFKIELFHTDDQTPAVPGRADHIVKLSHKPSDSYPGFQSDHFFFFFIFPLLGQSITDNQYH